MASTSKPSRCHAIGQTSNDLTQLMLGVDRDSELFGADHDERDKAVLAAIHSIITECRRLGSGSICGQAPSVHPEYVDRLVGATLPAESNGFFSHGLELWGPDANTLIERKVAIIELDRRIGALHGIDPGRSAGSASYSEN